MKPLRITLVIALLFAALAACSSEQKKPVEEAVIVDKAMAIIESVRLGYVAHDFEALGQETTPELKKKIQAESKGFNSVELEITPKWVDIEQKPLGRTKKLLVRTLWKGSWKVGDKTYDEQGNAVFVLDGDPLLLQEINGNDPFTHPQPK